MILKAADSIRIINQMDDLLPINDSSRTDWGLLIEDFDQMDQELIMNFGLIGVFSQMDWKLIILEH